MCSSPSIWLHKRQGRTLAALAHRAEHPSLFCCRVEPKTYQVTYKRCLRSALKPASFSIALTAWPDAPSLLAVVDSYGCLFMTAVLFKHPAVSSGRDTSAFSYRSTPLRMTIQASREREAKVWRLPKTGNIANMVMQKVMIASPESGQVTVAVKAVRQANDQTFEPNLEGQPKVAPNAAGGHQFRRRLYLLGSLPGCAQGKRCAWT